MVGELFITKVIKCTSNSSLLLSMVTSEVINYDMKIDGLISSPCSPPVQLAEQLSH